MSHHPGQRKGVIRVFSHGGGHHGYIPVNGHPPVSRRLRNAILDYMKRINRPVVSRELADELRFSPGHIRHVMRWMYEDGDLSADLIGVRGTWPVYSLPGHRYDPIGPHKQCSRCERDLEIDEFGRDAQTQDGLSSRCRDCRAPSGRATRRYRAREAVS